MLSLAAGAVLSLCASSARADVTSWFYLGGGVASSAWTPSPTRHPGTFSAELGMGSPPNKAVIIGALAKTFTYFGQGTDLGLTSRVATGGFVRGDFGAALDLGAYRRFWELGSTGFLGAVVLGGPFGVQLIASIELGSNDVRAFNATIGIDLLRLTVYRTAYQSYLPNPLAPTRVDEPR